MKNRTFSFSEFAEKISVQCILTYLFLKMIWNTAWDLDEFWLADVCPEVLKENNHTWSTRDFMSFKVYTKIHTDNAKICMWKLKIGENMTGDLRVEKAAYKPFFMVC